MSFKHADKLLHALIGFILFMLGVLFLDASLGWALCAVGAVVKEANDSRTRHGNRWSYADIVATLAGGAFGHAILWSLG